MVYLLTRSLDVCTVVSAVLSKGFGKERSDERILYGSLVSGILLFTDQNNLIFFTLLGSYVFRIVSSMVYNVFLSSWELQESLYRLLLPS